MLTVRTAATGGWLLFASGPRVLAVAAGDDAFVESGWDAVRDADGFQRCLDLLTERGLGATPAFALVEWAAGSPARVVVRHAVVEVTDATGPQSLDASGIATWVERTLPDAVALAFSVPGAAPSDRSLPLESGVAIVAGFTWGDGVEAAPVAVVKEAPAPPFTPPTIEPVEIKPLEIEPEAPPADDVESTRVVAPEPEAVVEETQFRAVPAGAPSVDTDPGTPEGDHDGHTVLTSDIARLRRSRAGQPVTPLAPPPAPAAVVVVLPSGEREPLIQPIIVGRNPSVSKITGGVMPRLVTVGGIDQDISRNHVQFALEGGTVVVTDLHSKNGTSIVLPGKEPQKLRAGEPTSVLVGTVVDLGGGVSFAVEADAWGVRPRSLPSFRATPSSSCSGRAASAMSSSTTRSCRAAVSP